MPLFELKNIYKTYLLGKIEINALIDISIDIEKGEFAALVGPSGSGKTTLLNLMGCLDNPTRGEIVLNGHNLSNLTPREQAFIRRREIGFIFQSYNLIPVMTSYENVAFPLLISGISSDGEIKDRVNAIIKEVGLYEQKDRRPDLLSGGQQQRIAIARALVKTPSIVLADEPTANLDSHTATEILELMRELNKKHGITFVFSTHDSLVMSFARRIITLHDGRIASDETKS